MNGRNHPSSRLISDDESKFFCITLSCAFLCAFDLYRLTQTCTQLRILSTPTTHPLYVLTIPPQYNPRRFLGLLTSKFPSTRELFLHGHHRGTVLQALQGAALMKSIQHLHIAFSDYCPPMDDPWLDGLALGATMAGFSQLSRLSLLNLGPFSPHALSRALCSRASLQQVSISNAPLLMDFTLFSIVAHLPCLLELSIESCASLRRVKLQSRSLSKLQLSACFHLRDVDVNRCPKLVSLDLPWTVTLTEFARPLPSQVQYLSVPAASALLTFYSVTRLMSIDLSCCTKLVSISLLHCEELIHFQCEFCVMLESVVLKHMHRLVELDLSLLPRLSRVEISEARCLQRLSTEGCPLLPVHGGVIQS